MNRYIFSLALILASTLPANSYAAGQASRDATNECIDLYYGIGGPADYQKAYKCFELQLPQRSEALAFVIVMQLNGEGVPPSAVKAREIFNDWRKARAVDGSFLFKDGSRLWPILIRGESPTLPLTPRLDYCKDVAQSMADERFCDEIEATLEKQYSDKTLDAIRAKLPAEEALLWDHMIIAFNGYEQAEASRADAAYSPGTGAPAAAIGQGELVRKNFTSLMSQVFGEKRLPSGSKEDLARAEAELKSANEADVAENAGVLKDKSSSEDDVRYARAYIDSAADSQKVWEAYRDLCVALAEHVYKDKGGSFDPSLSMKRALTQMRIDEIKAPL